MNFSISAGTLYADNLFFCYVEPGNGRETLPTGRYPITAQFSHKHGANLPNANGLGWIGASTEHDIVLGRVRTGNALLPCTGHISRLLAILEAAEDRGQSVELVVSDA